MLICKLGDCIHCFECVRETGKGFVCRKDSTKFPDGRGCEHFTDPHSPLGLYAVTASYNGNIQKRTFYVRAFSKEQAKNRFETNIKYISFERAEELTPDESLGILQRPDRFIIV